MGVPAGAVLGGVITSVVTARCVRGWVIEDGSIVPPKVGNTVSVALQFHQYTPDPADPRTCTVRAGAQPIQADAPPIVDRDGQWWWTIMLHGDGWSAVCRTLRPLIDHVEVTGMFFAHIELGSGTARGLVRRVQLMTGETTFDPHTRSWAAVADEDIRYTDIEASPRRFERPDPPDPAHADHPVERQLGVMIELDLGAAEPAPLRPRVRPGVISSGGRVLWALDRQLPVLLQLDDPAGAAVTTEHLLPLSIATTAFSPPRGRVVADAAGCWVVAEQTVLRCTLDAAGALEVYRIDLGHRMAAAAAWLGAAHRGRGRVSAASRHRTAEGGVADRTMGGGYLGRVRGGGAGRARGRGGAIPADLSYGAHRSRRHGHRRTADAVVVSCSCRLHR
ncbi:MULTISPECIES: hypothetical protein [Rhodococcus]|uniref:hypothetical protein n=1 Tax=Rhodococcus TaxID=1827 RepID=UPI0010228CE9|nr:MULTISPECIES: hypothetical protein [Rhodococcus]UTT50948.1 hypothetical protein NMQ04_21640 [Rhodococcus gordoniae]